MGTDTTPDLTAAEQEQLDAQREAVAAVLARNEIEVEEQWLLASEIVDAVRLASSSDLEAGETRTEWGVRSGEYVDAHPTGQSARTEVRRYGGDLMRRRVGLWVPVEDEAGA